MSLFSIILILCLFLHFFPGTFYQILGRPCEVPEERDTGFYDVSLAIILIFIIFYCVSEL